MTKSPEMSEPAASIQKQLPPTGRLSPFIQNSARGVALFLAGFTLLNLGGELFHRGFDASVWWLDLRGFPSWISNTLMLMFSLVLLGFACKPAASRFVVGLRTLTIVCAILIAARDAITFHDLLNRNVISSHFPLPFSMLVAALLLLVLVAVHLQSPTGLTPICGWAAIAASAAFCLVVFPLLQIHCFGWTDYRRPADVVVVFGCKVYSNGNLSTALADRVRSASGLYQDGLVTHLIMSGGPGQGDVHETDAMRDFAVSLGVPREQILTDRLGLSTDETVTHTVPMLKKHGFDRVLAVSRYFHLPRIKLTYQRAGVDVFTVPAHQNNRLPNQAFMLVREVAALWAYYARPLTGL